MADFTSGFKKLTPMKGLGGKNTKGGDFCCFFLQGDVQFSLFGMGFP